MRDMIYIRIRNIQSAKPSKTKVVPEENVTAEVDIESPDPLAKLRAPSAPAGEYTNRYTSQQNLHKIKYVYVHSPIAEF